MQILQIINIKRIGSVKQKGQLLKNIKMFSKFVFSNFSKLYFINLLISRFYFFVVEIFMDLYKNSGINFPKFDKIKNNKKSNVCKIKFFVCFVNVNFYILQITINFKKNHQEEKYWNRQRKIKKFKFKIFGNRTTTTRKW